MPDEREIPTGRLTRLSRLARVGARSGLSFLGRGDGVAAAQQAVELLGNLRGVAAKIGQMVSYVDGLVPDGQRDAYGRLLSRLQKATPSSPFAKLQPLIESELGGPLDRLFSEFDPQPMASASIGQVHRARLPDGLEVVVKVQHPGIELAIEQDLSSAGSLVSMAAALGLRGVDMPSLQRELTLRFREELDYRLEAERQRLFASFFPDEPRIHVPRVIASHSAQRVLSSELVRGLDLEQAVLAPEAERRAYAELLWRFVYGAILVHGVFNADPHPGNYIFHESGQITFLDFGCVQEVDSEFLAGARCMHSAAVSGDEPNFRLAAARACRSVPGPYATELASYLWRYLEPLKHSPYRIERSYVAELVRSTHKLARHLRERNSNMTQPPNGILLLNRLQFGFFSVLARFDVACDYAAVDNALRSSLTR